MTLTTSDFDEMTEKALARDDLTVDQKINSVINLALCGDRDKDAGSIKSALARAGFRIVSTEDGGKIDIPEHHQVFCKAVARVAKEHGMDNLSGTYSPGWKDPWSAQIHFSWTQGRHGADSDKIFISSEMQVRAKIDPHPHS